MNARRFPKQRAWRAASGLTLAALGELLGKSDETVRRYELAFNDPRRTVPPPEVMRKIARISDEYLTAADYPPPRSEGA